MTTRLEYLQNHINSLGDKWQPNGGLVSVKKIWDANRKKFNLNFFAKCQYIAFFEDKDGVVDYILDLEENELDAFEDIGLIGQHPWYVLDLDNTKVVGRYFPPDKFGEGKHYEKY